MSSDTQKRKKPNKKKRAPTETSSEPAKASVAKHDGQNSDSFNPKQRLRAHISAMKKDRAKGSLACEENANHDY